MWSLGEKICIRNTCRTKMKATSYKSTVIYRDDSIRIAISFLKNLLSLFRNACSRCLQVWILQCLVISSRLSKYVYPVISLIMTLLYSIETGYINIITVYLSVCSSVIWKTTNPLPLKFMYILKSRQMIFNNANQHVL